MSDFRELRILVLAEEAAAHRWADMLVGSPVDVRINQPGPETDWKPEIILTDGSRGDLWELSDCGAIRIGSRGPADVELPADCTARELGIACQLLAQVVRLRRQNHLAAETHRRLSAAALTDPVTDLPNRRAWDLTLPERCAELGDSRRLLCLAIFDLDYFKQVNDNHGHAAGDAVLREAGRAIGEALRQDDFVARLGGDEFGLLIWVPGAAVAQTVVRRVQSGFPARFAQLGLPLVTTSAGYQVTCAGGAAGDANGEALYAAADAALREAKRRGRNQTVAAEPWASGPP
jgi:diguanylate cyclase (GGDEF)-like protein